jgi:hypothetical protein
MMLAAISGQGSWIPDGTASELNIFAKSMGLMWRPRPELNWCTRFCRPLRNHSATWPHGTDLLQTIKDLGNLLRRVRRQFLKSGFNAEMALPPRRDRQQSSLSEGRQGQPGTAIPLATMIFRKKSGSLPDFSSKLVQAAADALS